MKQQNRAPCADFIKISATGTASLIFSAQPKSDVQRSELTGAISVKEKSGDASAALATTRSTKKTKHPVENHSLAKKMDHKTSEKNPEIAFFIVEGTYRLATINSNDYGFQLSARLALTYLDKAIDMLASKTTVDRAMLAEIKELKRDALQLITEYVALDKYCLECQRFNQMETHGWTEWVSKWAVRVVSRSHLGNLSQHLAGKIRAFHAMACSILLE